MEPRLTLPKEQAIKEIQENLDIANEDEVTEEDLQGAMYGIALAALQACAEEKQRDVANFMSYYLRTPIR